MTTKSGAPLRIGLLWHSRNSGNLGVGALTVSDIAIIDRVAAELGRDVHYAVIGPREPGPSYVEGDNIEGLSISTRTLLDPRHYWSLLGRLDGVIDIGGGDSFAGIYGMRRFAFIWLTKIFALLRGKPLLLAPQTIGPFDKQPYRWMAALAMRRAKAVIARDPMSFKAVREIAPRATCVQAIDVAFELPYKAAKLASDGKIRIGVNVSGLLYHGGFGRNNDFGLDVNYAELMTRFIDELLKRPNVEVHLITHVVSSNLKVEDDGYVADLLAARDPRIVRVPDFASPSAAKSYISGLDLLVAGRMHACIAAFSSGVPVLPIAYSRKFSGLFEGVLDYRHGVPVKGVTTDEALSYLMGKIDHRDELAEEIRVALLRVQSAMDVYRGILRDYLRAL